LHFIKSKIGIFQDGIIKKESFSMIIGPKAVTLPVHKTKGGQIMAAGADILNGFDVHFIYAYAFKEGITGMSTKPHVHTYDEAIFFMGSDPTNFEDLGATVEFAIGPKEEEKFTFDKATAVVVPKGIYHCPMRTLKLTKPYLCMAVSLTPRRED
jgi:hypothetical protein